MGLLNCSGISFLQKKGIQPLKKFPQVPKGYDVRCENKNVEKVECVMDGFYEKSFLRTFAQIVESNGEEFLPTILKVRIRVISNWQSSLNFEYRFFKILQNSKVYRILEK